MKELPNSELDERLQKQAQLAREALGKGGIDYVVQVCGQLLVHQPGAYEVRSLLWQALYSELQPSGLSWLQDQSNSLTFKLATRSLLKNDPIELIRRCDERLRDKQVFSELFFTLDRAAEALAWNETRLVIYRALTDLRPDKIPLRLQWAQLLLDMKRPQQSIECLEWVLAKDPGNSGAQTLLKNASVAETLQRGNWEDTDSSFHSKKLS